MINFFRNIRRRLLDSGSLRKYLVYAFGEIILVVLGILIALQINAWNQGRLNRKEERVILHNLHEEFLRHQEVWTKHAPKIQKTIDITNQLVKLCGQNNQSITPQNIDTLILKSFEVPPFKSPQPVLQELNSSGRLYLIHDDQLKSHLSEWLSKLDYLNLDDEMILDWTKFRIHPYLINRVPYKNWDIAEGKRPAQERSVLGKDYSFIFNDLEFENVMVNRAYFLQRKQSRINELKELIDEIIEETADY
ncbi:MAG: hypothetical protein GC192_15240 [Bacteroidetes bacterium]|nr:hypothetical protein [Bacteroidota bacterium]